MRLEITIEAVDRASAVMAAIREKVAGVGQVTAQVAASAGGIGNVAQTAESVLNQLAVSLTGVPNALGEMAQALEANAGQMTGLAAGTEASAAALDSLQKASVESAPNVAEVADAIATIQEKSEASAATTQATAKNLGGVAKAIKDSSMEAGPASTAIGLINETLARLSETTQQVVNSQALFAQSTARMAPLLAQNAKSIRQANEESERSLGRTAAKNAGEAEGAFSNFESALKRVGMTLKDVDQETTQSTSSWQRIRDVVSQNRVVFAGVAAAIASVPASLVLLTRNAISTGDSLNDMATQTGVSVELLSSLDLVARQNGSNVNELAFGFKQLSRAMVEAVNPQSEAAKNFRALGIDINKLSEDQKELSNLLPLLADGFAGLENGAGKLAIAQALLGRAGAQLIPVFNQGAAGFDAARRKAKELEIQMSAGTAGAADRLNDKLTELGAVFRGLGNQIAAAALPHLTAFVDFALKHSGVVKAGFLAIAGAVTAIGLAIATVKIGGMIDALLTAIAGPAALAKVTTMTGAVQALVGGFRNLLAPIGAAGAAANTAFGASMLARIGAIGFILGGTIAIINNLTLAWKRYQAAQKEALAEKELSDTNTNLRKIVEKQITDYEQQGKITQAKANEFRNRLSQAFTPATPTRVPEVMTGITAGVTTAYRTEFKADALEEASVMRSIIAETIDLVEVRNDVTNATREAVNYSKTEVALAQSKLDVFRAQKDLELARVREEQDQPFSTVTVDESVRRQTEILRQVKEAEEEFIRKQTDIQIAEVERQAKADPRWTQWKDKAAAEVAIKAETANDIRQIEAQRDSDLAKTQATFDTRIIELTQTRVAGQLDAEKRGAQNRLEIAQMHNEELVAAEIELQQTITRLREEQKNLPADQRLTEQQIQEAALFQFQRNTMAIRQRKQQELLDLKKAEIEANKVLIQTDPSPDAARKQTALNELIRQHNVLLREEIQRNLEALESGTLSQEQTVERRRRIIELQTELVVNNRQANLQDPTNLPRLQSELGFQAKLDKFGEDTGEREMIAPFRALDDFLTGTLQVTFNSLSQSIAGLFTGATTWAQVWTQAGNQIIGMIVQLILEYTIFHQIRSALDGMFHAGARANIAGTAAAGKAAQTSAAATAASTAGTVAVASAPAAAATSIWSFGSSATIGLVLALAAIAAIVAALAFAQGGVVPRKPRVVEAFASGGLVGAGGMFSGPGGEREDKIATRVPPGTGILNAAAVRYYGGQRFVTDLVREGLLVRNVALPTWSPPGGDDVPIRVSPGEAWLAPEVVARIGGPRVLAALNARAISPAVLRGDVASAVRASMPRFATGGMVGLTHLEMPAYEVGGVVGVEAGAARATRINELLQAQVENNPTVNVPAPEIYLLKHYHPDVERAKCKNRQCFQG